jgi:hypothetical protein
MTTPTMFPWDKKLEHEKIPRTKKSLSQKCINSLTAIRVLAGTKNSRPEGFYSRNSTKSTVNPNTTIPQI